MKIVCDSCGAKYSIADEKVAGRVFKIRCKKCGAAIVVKGDAGPAAEAAPAAGAAGFDYGGEAVWHTVVDGEQQGPFAPAQLGAMISANTIGWDAYVWREGFDDWKPAQDIEELVQAIMNPGAAPAAAAAEDPFSDQPTMGMAGPAGGGKSNPPGGAAKASKRDAGADLFAQSEASPFGGGGEDDDVVASAPSPRVGANQAMTGSRNENSVLFSLSNLQALATGTPGGPSPSPSPSKASGGSPKAGMAAGEGSGLIDIRALASATGLTGGGGGFGSGPAIGSAPPKLDELISIGAPTGGLGGALGAPVIIAEKPEPARGGGAGMIAAAAIIGIALLGGAGIFAYVYTNQPDPAAGTAATAAIAPTPPPVTAAAPPPPTTTVVAVADPVGGVPPATTATAAPTGGGGGGGGGSRGGRRPTGGGSSAPSTGGGGTTASAPPPATRAPSGGGGDRSIDDLLSSALGPSTGGRPAPRGGSSTAAPPPAAADSSLPASPARGDVMSAMTAVRGDVVACGGGQHGLATVAVGVTGSTGRVSTATVSGQFAGTPVGSCVARAVRGATFPHFRNPTFSFNFPFQL